MLEKIKHYFYWKFKAKPSGLLRTPRDHRDFHVGIFGWGEYKPKHNRLLLKTISVKHQFRNCCQWNATIAQKEPDEEMELSVRMMVAKGVRDGLVSGDGFSNLRSGQKVLYSFGAVERGMIREKAVNNDWTEYIRVNTSLHNNNASKHKTGSFWSVRKRDDILKLLDEKRILVTGTSWYTGFNQSRGFAYPWLITKSSGYKVGGHAFIIIGYDLNYKGRKVYIIQNSYGKGWGDNGKFYIEMDYLDRYNYGFFVNLDEIDKELGKFIMEYDGKNVRGDKLNGIFHIQAGKKKPYTSWASYLAWNGLQRGYSEVKQELIDRVEEGYTMDIKKTKFWERLRNMDDSNQIDYLLELLNKDK